MSLSDTERQKLARMRVESDNNQEKLAELVNLNKWNNYYEKRKKIFFDKRASTTNEEFLQRMDNFQAKKTTHLDGARMKQNKEILELAKPTLSPISLEMTKDRKPFVKQIDEIIQKSKSQARLKNNQAPQAERPVTPIKKEIDAFRDMEVRVKSDLFYKKHRNWEKTRDMNRFEERVKEKLVQEKLSSFTPKLNDKKNKELVKEGFDTRQKSAISKREAKIRLVEEELTQNLFKPRLFRPKA